MYKEDFEKNIYIKFSDSSVIADFKIYYYTKDFSLQWLLKAHSLTVYTAIFNSKYLSIDNDYKYSFVMDFMQKLYDYIWSKVYGELHVAFIENIN